MACGQDKTLMCWGVGNHGGGPTKGDIEYLKSNLRREGFNDLEFSFTVCECDPAICGLK